MSILHMCKEILKTSVRETVSYNQLEMPLMHIIRKEIGYELNHSSLVVDTVYKENVPTI